MYEEYILVGYWRNIPLIDDDDIEYDSGFIFLSDGTGIKTNTYMGPLCVDAIEWQLDDGKLKIYRKDYGELWEQNNNLTFKENYADRMTALHTEDEPAMFDFILIGASNKFYRNTNSPRNDAELREIINKLRKQAQTQGKGT